MNRTRCTTLLGIILTSLVILTAHADSADKGRKNRFASSDGAFHFDYPASLVRCERNSSQSDLWEPDESCEAYTPVCSDFSGQSDETVACIAYPAAGMKGTNFQAGAFSVSVIKAATAQAECLKVEEPPPHVGSARKETVNGVIFTVIETDGVATGFAINTARTRGLAFRRT